MIEDVYNLRRVMGLNLSPASRAHATPNPGIGSVWSFVYVFFSNGTPFDSPNRSEVCPCSMAGR
jgi:hypothetical protein